MYKFYNNLLPHAFESFFKKIDLVHSYNARLAAKQTYYLPKARNGVFNTRFKGPNLWNAVDESIKTSSLSSFKKKLKLNNLESY